MTYSSKFSPFISLATLVLASCSTAQDVDTSSEGTGSSSAAPAFTTEEHGSFNQPWASAFVPGTELLVVTQKSGDLIAYDTATKQRRKITGAPDVDYGGQGGLGDVAFLESETSNNTGSRTIYLSWVEGGENDTRGAVVGKGTFSCAETCTVENLEVIWRQSVKVKGRGHYSHRILITPDESHLYIASGDRQKREPAQNNANTLGTIVRLNMDGTPAADNPWADKAAPTNQIWSWGHRNILGMDFDANGRLWEIEHGPAGGDELNIVTKAANYGWPTRSNGDHYNGKDIPDHTADDGFAKPAGNWTPVIAPGDMLIYRGDMFKNLKGDALVAGLGAKALVHIDLDGESANEKARFGLDDNRLRSVAEGPDGSIWVLEDGEEGRLLHLTSK